MKKIALSFLLCLVGSSTTPHPLHETTLIHIELASLVTCLALMCGAQLLKKCAPTSYRAYVIRDEYEHSLHLGDVLILLGCAGLGALFANGKRNMGKQPSILDNGYIIQK